MGTLSQMIGNTKSALAARIGAVLMLRKYGSTEASDEIETAVQGASGGLLTEDASTAETASAITKSDDTDTSAITAKGLLVGGAGNLIIRSVGAPTTTVTIAVVAGQYVPVQCSRVMAATTATGLVGLS